MSTYRIAIVGSKESVGGFALLGVDIVAVEPDAKVGDELLRLKRLTHADERGVERNVYAIVFITEDLASQLTPDEEKKLAKGALPAIIPLPSSMGAGYGMERLNRIVERAIGSNILQ